MALPLLALAACGPASVGPETTVSGAPTGCVVARVIDGDSVVLACEGDDEETPVRLAGFDAPEIFRPRCAEEAERGFAAKAALEEMIAGADALGVALVGKGRSAPLVRMEIDGEDAADRMIAAGYAERAEPEGSADWCP